MFFVSSFINICFYSLLISIAFWTWNANPNIQYWVEETIITKARSFISKDKEVKLLPTKTPIDVLYKQTQPKDNVLSMQPSVIYAPVLMLSTKYIDPDTNRTEEGFIIWDMIHGELLLNLDKWEMSSGTSNLILDALTKSHMQLLTFITQNPISKTELLQQAPSIPIYNLRNVLNECIKYGLIVEQNNILQLHIKSPKIPLSPPSFTREMLQQYKALPYIEQIPKDCMLPPKYTQSQLMHLSHTLFSQQIYIREASTAYIPILLFKYATPTGEAATKYYNAQSGTEYNIF